MTYPWPNVTLVTLREKQENSNCQKLLALYMHTRSVMHQNTATVEQQWQTDLKINTCVWEGSDSKVIWSLNGSGCRHLLYKSFHMPQLELSDRMRSAKSKWERTCWISLLLWWGLGVHALITELLTWLHEGSQFSKYQHDLSFATPCSLDWILLWQILCTAVALFLWLNLSGQIYLEHKNALTQKGTHQCTHKWAHAQAFSASSCSS